MHHHRDETCPCPTCSHLARMLEQVEAETPDTPEQERLLARDEAERELAAQEALSEWVEEQRDDFRDIPMGDFEAWSAGEVLSSPRITREQWDEAEAALADDEEELFAEWLRERRSA